MSAGGNRLKLSAYMKKAKRKKNKPTAWNHFVMPIRQRGEEVEIVSYNR